MSLVMGREPVILGEGVEFFRIKTPRALYNRTIVDAGIGTLTGLIVLGVETTGGVDVNLSPDFRISENSSLDMLGTVEQLKKFQETFVD